MRPTPRLAPPKPVSKIWKPELTRLPWLHLRRRVFRGFVRLLARVLIRLLTRPTYRGLQHLPKAPALVVTNHLGDADTPLVLSALRTAPEALGKIELLFEFPVLGWLMDWYGTIWLHRGRVDRAALECATQALHQGRTLIIAPEGRYTLVRGLERGGGGAAYVAARAGVPIVPIALTGTENDSVYPSLRRVRRPHVTLTVGEPFRLGSSAESPRGRREATRQIMESIARLLPPGYRGAYADPRT
jgi:1-acyl-sn-glycerol-3-phosphate acyltransferase